MDRAINKTTQEIVNAFKVYEDSSHQLPEEDVWIAPEDSISNWDELKEQGIDEVPVHYVREKKFTNFKGTDVTCAPHFAKNPNHPAKTIPESPVHKALKNWLFDKLIKDDLEIVYSTTKKPYKHDNHIKISELKIDWNRYHIEVTSRGYRTIRADIMLPFLRKHEILGEGIRFEIQRQKQRLNRIRSRTFDGALNGYSTIWLWENDFEFNKNMTEIEIKKNQLKAYSHASEIYYSGKEYVKNLIRTVVEQTRLLDEKLIVCSNKSDEKIGELEQQKDYIRDRTILEIDTHLRKKISEISNGFEESISNHIQNTFLINRKDEFQKMVNKFLSEYLLNHTIDEIKNNILNNIDLNNIREMVYSNIEADVSKKISALNVFKNLIQEPPCCPKCNHDLIIKRGNYGPFWGCSNWPNCKFIQRLPPKIKEELIDLW